MLHLLLDDLLQFIRDVKCEPEHVFLFLFGILGNHSFNGFQSLLLNPGFVLRLVILLVAVLTRQFAFDWLSSFYENLAGICLMVKFLFILECQSKRVENALFSFVHQVLVVELWVTVLARTGHCLGFFSLVSVRYSATMQVLDIRINFGMSTIKRRHSIKQGFSWPAEELLNICFKSLVSFQVFLQLLMGGSRDLD
jgi:hypothetical protein